MNCEDFLEKLETGGIVSRLRARAHLLHCRCCQQAQKRLAEVKHELSNAKPLSATQREMWMAAARLDTANRGRGRLRTSTRVAIACLATAVAVIVGVGLWHVLQDDSRRIVDVVPQRQERNTEARAEIEERLIADDKLRRQEENALAETENVGSRLQRQERNALAELEVVDVEPHMDNLLIEPPTLILGTRSNEQTVAAAKAIVVATFMDSTPAKSNGPGDETEAFLRFRVVRILKGELDKKTVTVCHRFTVGRNVNDLVREGEESILVLTPEFMAGSPSGEHAVSRWTAPRAGRVSVRGKFGAGNAGQVDVRVLHNGKSLFSVLNTEKDEPFTLEIEVRKGDAIDFDVGAGRNGYFSGATPVEAEIIWTRAEPTTMHKRQWSLTRDFSREQNPNKSWSYGWTRGSAEQFTLLTKYQENGFTGWFRLPKNSGGGVPAVAANDTKTTLEGVAPGEVNMHPGPTGEHAVSRWILKPNHPNQRMKTPDLTPGSPPSNSNPNSVPSWRPSRASRSLPR